jgi:glycerophosphoryl diester phosphodiesterase
MTTAPGRLPKTTDTGRHSSKSTQTPGQGNNPREATKPAAHDRGPTLLWLENSPLAFGNALNLGVDDLECDVHLTCDGEVVMILTTDWPDLTKALVKGRG